MWDAVGRVVAQKKGLSWVRSLQPVSIDAQTVRLTAAPGQRAVLGFASTPANREQIAELFRQAIGRSPRVEIEPPASPPVAAGPTTDVSVVPGVQPPRPRRPAIPPPGTADPAAAAAGPRPLSQQDRQAIAALPLVRAVMEQFDARILDARPEHPDETPGRLADPAGDADAPPSPAEGPGRQAVLPDDLDLMDADDADLGTGMGDERDD